MSREKLDPMTELFTAVHGHLCGDLTGLIMGQKLGLDGQETYDRFPV